jgi:uncharacterized protein with von Willebrand factor type A (vWA) domain
MSQRGPIFNAADAAAYAHLGRNVIIFGRVLRRLGLGAQPDRLVLLAQALGAVGLQSREDVRAAARSVLVRNPQEAATFEVAFDVFWSAASLQSDVNDEEGAAGAPERKAGTPRGLETAASQPVQDARVDTASARNDGSDAAPASEQ